MTRLFLAVFALLMATAPASADTYPARPIRVLTSSSAGGLSDMFMRALGEEFQKATSNPHKRIAALNYLAQCFAKRKIYDIAASTLEDAIKEKLVFDDEKKELIYNLGSVFESMGRKEDAIEQFKTIYKVDTSYRDVEAKVDAYYSGQ